MALICKIVLTLLPPSLSLSSLSLFHSLSFSFSISHSLSHIYSSNLFSLYFLSFFLQSLSLALLFSPYFLSIWFSFLLSLYLSAIFYHSSSCFPLLFHLILFYSSLYLVFPLFSSGYCFINGTFQNNLYGFR